MENVEFDLNRNKFIYQNKQYDSFYEFKNKIEDEYIEIFWSKPSKESLSLIKKEFFFLHDKVNKIIIVKGLASQYSKSNEYVVLSLDAKFDHIIRFPESVYYIDNVWNTYPDKNHVNIKELPVELISQFYMNNDKLVGCYYFNYDWIQERTYNPHVRKWEDIVNVYKS